MVKVKQRQQLDQAGKMLQIPLSGLHVGSQGRLKQLALLRSKALARSLEPLLRGGNPAFNELQWTSHAWWLWRVDRTGDEAR
ncbi:MAG: hypothetical protein ACK59Y_02005 [Betaproteobacteria bacterium]